ncbi:MAG: hypothetical protein MJK18_03105, partial [Bdellovibrionales bacterium]|nr:hypothetical protein [Bdellovibrionales bacterium]
MHKLALFCCTLLVAFNVSANQEDYLLNSWWSNFMDGTHGAFYITEDGEAVYYYTESVFDASCRLSYAEEAEDYGDDYQEYVDESNAYLNRLLSLGSLECENTVTLYLDQEVEANKLSRIK